MPFTVIRNIAVNTNVVGSLHTNALVAIKQ